MLVGSLARESLAILQLEQSPCEIRFTFDVSLKNIIIDSVEGIPALAGANRLAVLKLALRKFLYHKIGSSVSEGYLKHAWMTPAYDD